MTLTIDFSNVAESKAAKLQPGVYDFSISSIEFGESQNKKTPFAKIMFTADEGVHTDTFYLTPDALPRLKHLLSKAGVADNVLSSSVNGEQLTKACLGKTFRGRLNGKEFVSSTDGVIRIAAEFAFSNFAEASGTNPSTLKFDPTKHIARLKPEGMSTSGLTNKEGIPVASAGDDMPF